MARTVWNRAKIVFWLHFFACAVFSSVSVLGAELRFASGFEGGVFITENQRDIRGSDGMDWEADLEGLPEVSRWSLNHIGRSPQYAFADLREDPTNADNRVLYFQLNDNDPESDATTRTQNELNYRRDGDVRFSEGYMRYRVFWHPDLNLLGQYPEKISWFTVMEWWEHRNAEKSGDRAGQSRWTLSFNKDAGAGKPLYWAIRAETMQPLEAKFKHMWPKQTNREAPIPIGEWALLEVFFQQGHGANGRIWVAITPEGGKRHTVFDVRNHTEHPEDPLGLRGWQLFKLYTSDQLLDWMRARDARVRAYYDDFEWWSDIPSSDGGH